MKRFLSVMGVAAAVIILAGVATAQMWGGAGGRWGGMGPGGGRGSGMMGPGGGYGPGANCPGFGAQSEAGQITEEKAKELAQQYAEKYLAGFTVDKVLPFTGMRHSMYSVELKNSAGDVRTLHVNPFGNVMPFGGPWQRRS